MHVHHNKTNLESIVPLYVYYQRSSYKPLASVITYSEGIAPMGKSQKGCDRTRRMDRRTACTSCKAAQSLIVAAKKCITVLPTCILIDRTTSILNDNLFIFICIKTYYGYSNYKYLEYPFQSGKPSGKMQRPEIHGSS